MQGERSTGRTGDEKGLCIHDLEPGVCKVCNGHVRRLIESREGAAT